MICVYQIIYAHLGIPNLRHNANNKVKSRSKSENARSFLCVLVNDSH